MKILSILIVFSAFIGSANSQNTDFVTYPEPLHAPVALFEDKNASLKTLGHYQNKVVVLNFWATWCKPCVFEMPSLNQLQTKYKAKGLQVLPIVADTEKVSKVRSFYRRYKLTGLDYFIDNNEFTAQSYQVREIPTSFVFNKQGKLIAYVSGSINWMSEANQEFLEKLLAE